MRGSDAVLAPLAAIAVLATIAACYAFSPVLLVQTYEADVYHLMDLEARLDLGLVPHLETATPLGILTVLPMHWLNDAGLPIGLAMLWSQFAAALICLVPLLYVARARFSGVTGALYVVLTILLITGLTYGDRSASVSFSMHYNRWCWALAMIAVPLALLPGYGRPSVEGVLIGLAFAGMALMKVTFFVALLPAVAVALLVRKAWGEILFAILTGALVAGVVTMEYGASFWVAYANDLISMVDAPFRDSPGNTLAAVAIFPDYLPGTVLALVAYWILRRDRQTSLAITSLILAAGAIYATFQSFGNPPLWYALVGVLLLGQISVSGRAVGAAFLVLASPFWVNLGYTIAWHTALARTGGVDVIEGQDLALQVYAERQDVFSVLAAYDTRNGVVRVLDGTVSGLDGDVLPDCSVTDGLVSWFNEMADGVQDAGASADGAMFVTDVISGIWLAGSGQPPRAQAVNGAAASAPWYYGGLPGIEAADLVVTPKCALDPLRRAAILKDLQASGLSFEKVADQPMLQIHRIIR